jgi:hypothetical protein
VQFPLPRGVRQRAGPTHRGTSYTRDVLILPPGHAEATFARRTLNTRERWILSGVLATTLALLVVVLISIATAGPKTSGGCINVTSPGFIGAQSVSGCGAQARAICHSALTGSGYTRGQNADVVAACRKQGVPLN